MILLFSIVLKDSDHCLFYDHRLLHGQVAPQPWVAPQPRVAPWTPATPQLRVAAWSLSVDATLPQLVVSSDADNILPSVPPLSWIALMPLNLHSCQLNFHSAVNRIIMAIILIFVEHLFLYA